MNYLLLFLLFLCILLSPDMSVAAGKVTVDPNTVSAKTIAEPEKDERLAKTVTYVVCHKGVKGILADLTRITGVTLNAGLSNRDWQVRDRKMNIFAKDVPLGQLMDSIAHVMKFKWRVNRESAPWTYRLYMDRKTLLGADAEAYRAQEALDKEITRRRQSWADIIDNLKDLSPEETEKLRNENPYLYLLHSRGAGKVWKTLFNEIPGLRDAFINREKNVVINIADLSPETRQLVMTAWKNAWQLKGYRWAGDGKPFPAEFEENPRLGSVCFDIKPRELDWDNLGQAVYFGGFGISFPGGFTSVSNACEPSSRHVQYSSECELQAFEQDTSLKDIKSQMMPELEASGADDMTVFLKAVNMDVEIEHPDKPDLHKKIKVKVEEQGFREYQAAVAESSGFAVVSDSFNLTRGAASIPETETELKDVLDTLSKGYRCNWEKQGPVIGFWNKNWYRYRTSQVPDEWLDAWHANMKQLGYMSLEDFAQIAALTNDQIEENIKSDKEFGMARVIDNRWFAERDRPTLLFYGSLSRIQRKQLLGRGLPVSLLQPEQMALLQKVFSTPEVEPGQIGIVLRCVINQSEKKEVKAVFTAVRVNDSTTLREWSIDLPIYKELPKPQPKPETNNDTPAKPASDQQVQTK